MHPKNGHQLDDSELIAFAQSGDRDAFGFLYDRYAEGIYRFIYLNTSDEFEAEDLTSDVFLRAWQSLPKYKEQGHPFSAYLFRIARNAIIDHHRSSRRNKDRVEALPDLIANQSNDPGLSAEKAQESKILMDSIYHLRENYRTVLILRFINGLSPREVAVVMGRSEGAVRVLQYRALRAIRRIWELRENEGQEN
jgi:RNA polymerase sigma-70 factor (ECF subfamily)